MLFGFVMPLFAVGMVVYLFGDPDERSLAPAWEVALLCIASGIGFAVPYWVSAWFLTVEFPSLIGSMVGGAITLSILRSGYLLPDDEWEFPDRERREDHWVGDIEPGQSNGANGGAMAGSNTVSNITFGAFQFEAATQLGLPRTIVVGAQAVGGATGNLVAIHNLVAALATVGLLGQEGRVTRLNLLPLLYYATGVGLLCLLFSYVLFPGVF